MKKIIDIEDETKKRLSHLAVEEGKDLKNFIQDLLIKVANLNEINFEKLKKIIGNENI